MMWTMQGTWVHFVMRLTVRIPKNRARFSRFGCAGHCRAKSCCNLKCNLWMWLFVLQLSQYYESNLEGSLVFKEAVRFTFRPLSGSLQVAAFMNYFNNCNFKMEVWRKMMVQFAAWKQTGFSNIRMLNKSTAVCSDLAKKINQLIDI